MANRQLIKHRLTALAAAVAMAAPLALLISMPTQAQQLCGFFGCYQQPPMMQERPQPPADYSKAPPAKKPEAPPSATVLVMGDSMADWLAYGLEEAFADTPEIGIVRKPKPNSGLIRYEARGDLEWSSVARDIMNTEKPAVVVMILGLNDRGPIRERPGAKPAAAQPEPPSAQSQPDAESPQLQIMAPEQPKTRGSAGEFRSEIWAELYSKRIADTITAMKSRGVPVVWVGLPIIRGPKATADAIYLNDLYRAQAEKAGIIYVDVWDGFVDEQGKFMSSGPDVEGQTRRLRAPDGVYFTKFGARKLAHYVEREIRRVISARISPVSLPLDTQPAPRHEGPVARPVTGAVLPLTAGPVPASEELLGAGPTRPAASDPIANRALVKGEAMAPLKGRADDFVWKGSGADLPAANMTAEPGTITPKEIPAAATEDGKEKSEAQVANQQQKKPPPRPTQAQPAQRPFFSPFSFFR